MTRSVSRWRNVSGPGMMGAKHYEPKKRSTQTTIMLNKAIMEDVQDGFRSDNICNTLQWLDKLVEKTPNFEGKITSFSYKEEIMKEVIARLKDKFVSISEALRFGTLLQAILKQQQK